MKPKLACNLSRPLIELIQDSVVDVDFLNLTRLDAVEGELREALLYRPVLLHMLGSGGQDPAYYQNIDWARFVPHTALHLELREKDWADMGTIPLQDRDTALVMIDRLITNFRFVSSKIDCPLLFKNIPYYGYRGTARIAIEAALMWQLVDEGFDMLLDISHLRCTAHNIGVDSYAFAKSLPLQAVREVHVAGPGLTEHGLHDSHDVLVDKDYQLLAWILNRTNPQFVTLEYGGTGPDFGVDESVLQEVIKT